MRSHMPTTDDARLPVKRALVSVYDKTGLDDLARALHEAGVALVSTGSTANRIAGAGGPGTQVEDLTGFPGGLQGRGPHRLPGVPGRPREAAAPQGARRDPGRPPSGDAPHPARGARHRAVRP